MSLTGNQPEKFTADDALRSRWRPGIAHKASVWFGVLGIVLLAAAVGSGMAASQWTGGAGALALLVCLLLAIGGAKCVLIAAVLRCSAVFGRLVARLAPVIFFGGLVGLVVVVWIPALLYASVDAMQTHVRMNGGTHAVTVSQITEELLGSGRMLSGWPKAAGAAAYVLWLLQFQLARDILAVVGAVGFVSLFAMFAIWWERKVAGRMQSRLGPMRVGGWHGWAQSLADGIKLLQKEDVFLAGADRILYRMAAYVSFIPALCLFLALPFSAVWVCRDMNVGLIFIFAMLGVGVLGVLLAGWASNNKWSMYGAMREACQMISYEIPLGFSLLVPIMAVGSLNLVDFGRVQAGGFATWLAFQNPFLLAAAVIFFIATLAECKRAPFDLPEAESELVAGYLTEYSGFRWALFFFAEYAEMFAVSALGAVLFFGAWHSPLPESWGAAWASGPLWQQALHGLLFSGPLWLIAKGIFLVYVQMWLRWTLPRVRLDQVMYACVQVLLPLMMIVLLGATFWMLLVPQSSLVALVARILGAAVGAAGVLAFVFIMAYGYMHRRKLVGTMVVDHLPGA